LTPKALFSLEMHKKMLHYFKGNIIIHIGNDIGIQKRHISLERIVDTGT
jgi:hypothetical protein